MICFIYRCIFSNSKMAEGYKVITYFFTFTVEKCMINPSKVSYGSRQCSINMHVKHNWLPLKVLNRSTATHSEAPSSWSLDSCKEDVKLDAPPNLKNNGNISDPSPPADSHKSFTFRQLTTFSFRQFRYALLTLGKKNTGTSANVHLA